VSTTRPFDPYTRLFFTSISPIVLLKIDPASDKPPGPTANRHVLLSLAKSTSGDAKSIFLPAVAFVGRRTPPS
jgi:hypothetical protein